MDDIPATEVRLNEIRMKLQEDSICRIIMNYCQDGWPGYEHPTITVSTRPYWLLREELSVCHGLLMRGSRLVIPSSMRAEILQKLHEGHQGIVKCRERAKNLVWWPGLSREIEDVVKNCSSCLKHRRERPEPLKPTDFPDRPWQQLGSDLFYWKGVNYLLVIRLFL
ncbi:uncharacterized protein K02A2.6-like [Pecten maximus]|uniref:uncharacterized protein K02A2.6-like n=1 Tax=Pecten maximus TaxID=6579 RepID=UPI001458E815|nr:uncharacterized protein K02A2.6-like [Pecten maximus]